MVILATFIFLAVSILCVAVQVQPAKLYPKCSSIACKNSRHPHPVRIGEPVKEKMKNGAKRKGIQRVRRVGCSVFEIDEGWLARGSRLSDKHSSRFMRCRLGRSAASVAPAELP